MISTVDQTQKRIKYHSVVCLILLVKKNMVWSLGYDPTQHRIFLSLYLIEILYRCALLSTPDYFSFRVFQAKHLGEGTFISCPGKGH